MQNFLLPPRRILTIISLTANTKEAQEPYPKPILPTEAFALPVKRKNK